MVILRITLCIMFFFGMSFILDIFFFYERSNIFLINLTMAPGIIPFIPLLYPKPNFGGRLVYMVFGIFIQIFMIQFELMWGNLWVLLIGVVGISFMYYGLLVCEKRNIYITYLGGIVLIVFLFHLSQQFYIYNKFLSEDICFNSEEYCGASCYKDYNEISCRNHVFRTNVFHGSPASYYRFSTDEGGIKAIFIDKHVKSEFILPNNKSNESK